MLIKDFFPVLSKAYKRVSIIVQRVALMTCVIIVCSCGKRFNLCTEDIAYIGLKRFVEDSTNTNICIDIDNKDWQSVLNEINRCRQKPGKYYPEATLIIEYGSGVIKEINLLSEANLLTIGRGGSPYMSKKPHPVLDRYLDYYRESE